MAEGHRPPQRAGGRGPRNPLQKNLRTKSVHFQANKMGCSVTHFRTLEGILGGDSGRAVGRGGGP